MPLLERLKDKDLKNNVKNLGKENLIVFQMMKLSKIRIKRKKLFIQNIKGKNKKKRMGKIKFKFMIPFI